MIRGVETAFKFDLPCTYTDLQKGGWVNIVFWQDGNSGNSTYGILPIVKNLDHCTQGTKSNQLIVRLSQTETARFSHERKAYTQLTGVTRSNIPIACKKRAITVYPIYDSAMLDGLMLPSADTDGWIYLDGQTIE